MLKRSEDIETLLTKSEVKNILESKFDQIPELEWNLFKVIDRQEHAYEPYGLARGVISPTHVDLFSNKLRYWPTSKIHFLGDSNCTLRVEFQSIEYFRNVLIIFVVILAGMALQESLNGQIINSVLIALIIIMILIVLPYCARRSQVGLLKRLSVIIERGDV